MTTVEQLLLPCSQVTDLKTHPLYSITPRHLAGPEGQAVHDSVANYSSDDRIFQCPSSSPFPLQASALLRTPPEIALDIFRLALDELPEPDTYLVGDPPTLAPWSISQVCRTWRDIAIGYPTFWSCVLLQSRKASSNPGQWELFQLQL